MRTIMKHSQKTKRTGRGWRTSTRRRKGKGREGKEGNLGRHGGSQGEGKGRRGGEKRRGEEGRTGGIFQPCPATQCHSARHMWSIPSVDSNIVALRL